MCYAFLFAGLSPRRAGSKLEKGDQLTLGVDGASEPGRANDLILRSDAQHRVSKDSPARNLVARSSRPLPGASRHEVCGSEFFLFKSAVTH